MKISGYAINNNPAATDYLLGNKASAPDTERFLLSDLITLFLNNIPAAEGGFPFVSSGLSWTADAAGSSRAASMLAGRIKVNTSFLSIGAVTSRIFTSNKDTYVDVLDNDDGTGQLVYTEVSNNAASPALAANSARIAIIITGPTNIANSGSINQGQIEAVLPIVSSVAYTVTDSLGNLICCRDPNHTLLGYRQITGVISAVSSSSSPGQIPGLSAIVKIPVGRKATVTVFIPEYATNGTTTPITSIWDGTVGSGTKIQGFDTPTLNASSYLGGANPISPPQQPSNTSDTTKTYNASVQNTTSATLDLNVSANSPAFMKVTL